MYTYYKAYTFAKNVLFLRRMALSPLTMELSYDKLRLFVFSLNGNKARGKY
jgi:hypothetical protein